MRFVAGAFVGRSLVVSVVCQLVIGASLASAQTVIVRHAAAGSTVELVVNATPVATGTVGSDGMATVVAPETKDVPLDANVWVDACTGSYRVIVARSGAQPPADAACRREQVAGLYLVQRITSLVIDVRDTPSLRVRQGPTPAEWLRDPVPVVAGESAPRPALPPLTGLTLFGGVGRGTTLNFTSQACGDVSSCTASAPMPYTGGIAWWFTPYLAAEARYAYLGDLEAQATTEAYRFTSTRESGVLSFAARVGGQAGRVRPYGLIGMTLHRATHTTNQTINDTTVEVDGVEQTIPGGSQILQYRSKGWAPTYGGGVEVWLSPVIGIFGEAQRVGLKGSDDRGANIDFDDAVVSVLGGLTVRFR